MRICQNCLGLKVIFDGKDYNVCNMCKGSGICDKKYISEPLFSNDRELFDETKHIKEENEDY